MLFGVVLGLSGFFKTRELGKTVIDDCPFRLFYGFTSGILFLCSALVGLTDLVGREVASAVFCAYLLQEKSSQQRKSHALLTPLDCLYISHDLCRSRA